MKGYYDGQQDAYYGFGRSSSCPDYERGFRDECELLERQNYEKGLEKKYERQYYAELYEYEYYLETKPKDCRP